MSESEKTVLQIIKGISGKKVLTSHNWQAEREIQGPCGTSWIAVYYRHWDSYFGVERYYESEYMNMEYGQSVKIPIDFEDYKKTVAAINDATKRLCA